MLKLPVTRISLKYLLIIICLVGFLRVNAQEKKVILKGKISDVANVGVAGAKVSLLTSDSVIVRTSGSDENGRFKMLDLPTGSYTLLVSSLNFINSEKKITLTNDTQTEIILGEKVLALNDVVVNGKAPMFERKIDRMVFNVGTSEIAKGNTLNNVLQLLPGVVIGTGGNIQLNGKNGLSFMVNGRLLKMTREQLAAFLKSTPSNNIDLIELITSPSAKYDAQGTAGLINIKLKKNRQFGLSTDIYTDYTQGIYGNGTAGINISYKTGVVNTFINYSHNKSNYLADEERERNFLDNVNSYRYFSKTFGRSTTRQNFINAGSDFYIGKKNIIGLMVDAGHNNNNDRSPSSTYIYKNLSSSPDSLTIIGSELLKKINDLNTNLNYTLLTDTSGSSFKFNVDYNLNRDLMEYQSSSTTFDHLSSAPGLSFLINYNSPTNIRILTVRGDYKALLKNKDYLEFGSKYSKVGTDNSISYSTISTVNNSNIFSYNEKVTAAYVSWTREEGKRWNFNAGLRLENTHTRGILNNGESDITKNYTDLFPTIAIQHNINEKNQLNVSYNRRINRPNYSDLNPFIIYTDRYNFSKGNPYLSPMYSHTVELSYMLLNKYYLTVSAAKTNNAYATVPVQNDQSKITAVEYQNLNRFLNYNIGLTIPITFAKWFSSNINLSYYLNRYTTVLTSGNGFRSSQSSIDINIYNSIKLPHGINLDISGFYVSPHTSGVELIKHKSSVSVGASKSFLKDNASISLRGSDIFYTNQENTLINFLNQNTTSHFKQDSRQISLSVSYRFFKGKPFEERKREKGNKQESQRIKQ
ncbi:outer membrane beta-barrel protein [Pedobacter sp. R20-19]|uniref:outer membrane beta-barrel protein n=1 Tax=Pedobacter sp. R20-19 TaxID=1270196 RepID=UPI00049399C4|nr:outer membrane beta-barrel protein [Pedobacter sp. R20-19]